MKKLIALLLAVACCVSMLSVAAFAAELEVEVDEDLSAILADIQALVEKYGPEIPEEVKNGTVEGTRSDYKFTENSFYVAIGDDTTYGVDTYVSLLGKAKDISYKNLADKGMMIEDVNEEFLEDNAEDILKADLVTISFSVNGFAALVVEEVLKKEESSYIDWSRYLPEEGVAEIEDVLNRMSEYMDGLGVEGNLPFNPDITLSDALVVAAESFAFGTLAYTYTLPVVVDQIHAMNPNAEILVVGSDNPMDGSTIKLSSGEGMDIGTYVDELVKAMDNASQAVAIERENVVFVSASDAANDNDGKELSETDLILSYLGGANSKKARPNADGHAYIKDQILLSMSPKGDIDGDGAVTYLDAMMCLQAAVGLVTPSAAAVAIGDTDADGMLSYMDAMKILQAAVGLVTL